MSTILRGQRTGCPWPTIPMSAPPAHRGFPKTGPSPSLSPSEQRDLRGEDGPELWPEEPLRALVGTSLTADGAGPDAAGAPPLGARRRRAARGGQGRGRLRAGAAPGRAGLRGGRQRYGREGRESPCGRARRRRRPATSEERERPATSPIST